MSPSVIISTYNQPEWLHKVLHGYLFQTFQKFEMVIADDGSDERTKTVIDAFKELAPFAVQHIWHPDDGFQKCKILNKATIAANGDYLIFTDGDCIPRRDFIETHVNHAAPATFLSGGYCKLPMDLSKLLSLADIESGAAFDIRYLRRNGLRGFSQTLRIGATEPVRPFLDWITPRKATWNGCNASTWKSDIIAVNGHNEEMQYGGEDREMGERLKNRGLSSKQIVYRALQLHLDHKRSYMIPETMKKNRAIREEVIASKSIWTPNGIIKQPHP